MSTNQASPRDRNPTDADRTERSGGTERIGGAGGGGDAGRSRRAEGSVAREASSRAYNSHSVRAFAAASRGYPLHIWLVSAVLVMLGVTGATSAGVGVWLIGKGISDQAQDKARLDLNSARLVFLQRLEDVRMSLRLTSLRRSLLQAVVAGDSEALRSEALAIRGELRHQYVDILDPSGRVLAHGQGPNTALREKIAAASLVSAITGGRGDVVSTFVRTADELAAEAPELAEQARMVLRGADGPEQPPREIGSALVIEGAAAVRNDAGELVGILRSGVILNHDRDTVDLIRNTIYEGEALAGHPTGGASLCLGDVRVATNMQLRNGQRAEGTAVDPIVRQRVLVANHAYVDRAKVLGEVHFTAYEPIRDPDGKPIGILSLGIPEEKYTVLRTQALAVFVGIVLLGVLVAVAIATRIGRLIVHPVRKLDQAVREYERGNLTLRLEPFKSTPTEIIELGIGLQAMAGALRERELQLKYRTEAQLGKAERLAMIGRLSAGVAHEINNPLGGILLFSSLLLKKAPTDAPDRNALERICNEAKRCQQIVQGLLDFARPREPKTEITVLENIIERSLQLVIGQSLFHNIIVKKSYGKPEARAQVDPAQLQQVVLNLIVNAAEAMEGKGTLTLVTDTVENGRSVQIEIGDTGCGVSKDNLERLFEPFFTTKEVGRGTGLGLSISRGIVEAHQGTIWAESEIGQGTCFFVRLPSADAMAASLTGPSSPPGQRLDDGNKVRELDAASHANGNTKVEASKPSKPVEDT